MWPRASFSPSLGHSLEVSPELPVTCATGLWGALGKLWPCVFKMQFHLLPPVLWLGPPPRFALAVPNTCPSVSRHKGHLRKALLVPHRQNSGRVTDGLPPGFQSRQNPLTYAPATAPPAPAKHRGGPGTQPAVFTAVSPGLLLFIYLFLPFLERREKSLRSAAKHTAGSSYAPRNTPAMREATPKPLRLAG